jgi:hypothetical protein
VVVDVVDDRDDGANKAMVGFGGGGNWRAAVVSGQVRRRENADARVVGSAAAVVVGVVEAVLERNNRNDVKPLLAVVVVDVESACQHQAEVVAAVTINVTSSKPIVQL